jgi:hypothetical protein
VDSEHYSIEASKCFAPFNVIAHDMELLVPSDIHSGVSLFSLGSIPLVGQGLIIDASRSLSIRHSTLGRTPLDERSARRRDLYLEPPNTYKRDVNAHEPAVATSSPQTA